MSHPEPNHPVPPVPALPTVAQLPVRLRDLLKREVCLEISRAHIEAAIQQVEREADELQQTRPPFLFLQTKATRSDFNTRKNTTADTLASLAQGLGEISDAQPKMRAWVEDDLETFIRDSQPAYMQGLACHGYPDDWQRAVIRFDQRTVSFRNALGVVQASLANVPRGVVLASHAGAFESLMPARQWGALLDYEFLFFNRLADLQRRALELNAATLKRTPEHKFASQIGHWARLDSDAVRRHIMELRARLELAIMDARAIYVTEAALANTEGTHPERSFVFLLWEYLRQLMRAEIDPAHVEAIVSETEHMVATAGR
ncbi:MAG: hypothetical protein NTU80_11080 [Verrucomicrobia bacterium]|nr:hypothetical protein [Verrucomicrobiota bacterium]